MDGLAGETRLIALRFKNKYEEIANDSKIIFETPPIKGLIRTSKNNDIDPLDGSTTKLWKKRLATIFQSVMKSSPEYDQIRLVSAGPKGKELIRVNRAKDGGAYIVKEGNLQEKYMESYMKESMKRDSKDVFFYHITYNREHGVVDERKIPMLRTILPIYDKDKLFAFIIINADYQALINEVFYEVNSGKDVFIVNSEGDYVEYKSDSKDASTEFIMSSERVDLTGFTKKLLGIDSKEGLLADKSFISYYVKIGINDLADDFVNVALRVPSDEIMDVVYKTGIDSLFLAGIITLICLIVSILATRAIINPLDKITDEITSGKKKLDLPIDLNDEIGKLAKAFKTKTESLMQSEEKVRTILDNVIDGIVTIDKNGKILTFNATCEKMYGVSENSVAGNDFGFLINNEKRLDGLLGEPYETTIKSVKNGNEVEIEIWVNQIKTANRTIFCGIIRDVTKRKRVEALKDDFISTMNHELRTPLTSIQGSVGLLKKKAYKKLDKESKKLLDLSYSNCERLLFLVNDLLDTERIAAGKMEYNIQVCEIIPLITKVAERYSGYAEKYQTKIVVKSNVKDVYCKVDPVRLSQALGNLLSNAVKYSPVGGEAIISTKMQTKKRLKISVIDHGEGIPDDFKDKVFDKFTQADNTSTRRKGGTGLGLNITKLIIEEFKGVIDFKSKKGKGTEFFVILPTVNKPLNNKNKKK